MAIDTAAKRAAAGHTHYNADLGVTPDATEPFIWRAAVAWNYGGTDLIPVTPGVGEGSIYLGLEDTVRLPGETRL